MLLDQRRYDMNRRSQSHGGKNLILPKEINTNRLFLDTERRNTRVGRAGGNNWCCVCYGGRGRGTYIEGDITLAYLYILSTPLTNMEESYTPGD
jgi:hypothetical protein